MTARHVTPSTLPSGRVCKSINIPSSLEWLGIFDKILLSGTETWEWQQLPDGAITVEDTIEFWQTVLADYWDEAACGATDYPTPFWDEDTSVDDQSPAETQVWYGEVTNPEAVAAELTFVENATIWVFTGFVAYAAGVGAAIFFHTVAEKWVLAWRRGDVGEVIRVIIDSAEYGTVDTTSAAEGDIVEFPVLAGAGEHDILLLKVS